MQKIKVFYFLTRLDPGGAQGSVLTTIKGLDKNRFIPYLAVGKGGRLDEKAKKELPHLYFISALRHPVQAKYLFHDALAVLQIGFILRKVKPDVVHTNAPKIGILGRLAAKIFYPKAKIVHTFHGLGFAKEHGEKHFKFFVATERFWAKLTDAMVFVSRRNEEEAKSLGIAEKVRSEIIRAGIDFTPKLPADFNAAAKKASLKIPANAKVVLCIANFKPLKNPLHFVLAAYKVLNQMKNVYFIFTGEGPLKETTMNLAKNLGIEKQLIFPGWRKDVAELLAISDVYASVSLREGLPVSLLEAMAYKVPSVCYDVDGIGEIVTDNRTGFLVPKQDINGLAEKIKALLRNNKLHARLVNTITRRDFGEFTVSVMLRKQQNLYNSLVPPKKNPNKNRFSRRKHHSRKKFGDRHGIRNKRNGAGSPQRRP